MNGRTGGWLSVCFALLVLAVTEAGADSRDYGLAPKAIALGVYVFEGANEDFSYRNGGNILNTGVIVGDEGVIVINTGPSRLYGEQLRAAIARLTDKPILRVYLSKPHPDHFLGNQAFRDVPIHAHPRAIELLRQQADQFTDNMYRLVDTWMLGTEPVLPTDIATAGVVRVGGRLLEVITLSGHTPGDLVVLDRASGVLFAGGIVFHDRAPTTPHADLKSWLAELERLRRVTYRILVPSHGPIAVDGGAIDQTAAYLHWLDQTLNHAARDGLDMAEALALDLPPEFAAMAVMPAEYQRSLNHLYRDYEARYLVPVGTTRDSGR
ncbi:MAG: quinoprotein relay system zinc metallohydrolase 1 [Thiotrichales bacterium]